MRHLNAIRLVARELLVARVADDNRTALASNDLLVGVQGFGEDVVTREDHDDGKGLVDECEYAVLEFTGHDGFAVEIGDFLDFEGALKDC